MNKENKRVKKAKERLDTFNPRGSKCPICNANFRKGCEHSVEQAKTKLFEDYIRAIGLK